MEKKSNLMEKEKEYLSPHHLARELCIASLAPLTGKAPDSQDGRTERVWGKARGGKKGDCLKERG